MKISPFTIDVPDAAVNDLKQRLENTRWPQQLDGTAWTWGTPVEYMKRILDHWLSGYSWRAEEQQLNSFDQFIADKNGARLHFIHQRSEHEHALPLVITHGWPGSVAEFRHVIKPLTQPEQFGADPADAFHVICPSMPGYGFSSAPEEPGCNTRAIAEGQLRLMQALGYERFGVQGGDWGAMVSSAMARLAPERVAGLHLNMVVAVPPAEGDPMAGVLPEEAAGLENLQHWRTEGGGYFRIQATRPHTLGFGLTDSPIGLAAWILEKFRDWSDCDGDIEKSFAIDEVLTNICLYWFSGSITSAARLYYEDEHSERDFSYIEVPTAGALFPREIIIPPRVWAEKLYNIQRWSRYDRGGHFAAFEVPELWLQDVRAFFRDLR